MKTMTLEKENLLSLPGEGNNYESHNISYIYWVHQGLSYLISISANKHSNYNFDDV